MVDITINPLVALENGMVSVSFSATDGTYTLNDAIVVLSVQYNEMTSVDIENEAKRRWDDWIAIVNPPAEEDVIDG